VLFDRRFLVPFWSVLGAGVRGIVGIKLSSAGGDWRLLLGTRASGCVRPPSGRDRQVASGAPPSRAAPGGASSLAQIKAGDGRGQAGVGSAPGATVRQQAGALGPRSRADPRRLQRA